MKITTIVCLVPFGALLVSSCTDLDVIPADAQLVCATDDECPAGFSCRLAIGRCLDNESAQAAPIAVVTPTTIDQPRRSRRDGFSLVAATATFSSTPVAVSGRLDDRVDLVCINDGVSVTCTIDLADVDDLSDGDHDIDIFADDGVGTVASSRARIVVDLVAPDVVAGSVVVTYLPRADNSLVATTAVGPKSDATIQLSLTEAFNETPAAVIDENGVALEFDDDTADRIAVMVVDRDSIAGLPDGDIDVTLTLRDDVGNARDIALPALFRVDQTAPAVAAVDVADAVVYERVPEGSRATAGAAQFTVRISAGVEPGARVVVTTAVEFDSAVLGEGVADAAGSVTVDLAPVDLPRVFVHVVDDAGNVGDAARVRDIRWTASLGGRVVGDQRSNPHALFAATAFDGVSLTPHLRREIDTAADLVTGDGVDVVARGEFVLDRVLGADTPITAAVSVVWHAARGEILAFGGITPDGIAHTSRLLRLQDERWEPVSVEGVAPPPAAGTAVYDPVGERLVVVQDDGQTWFFEDTGWRPFAGERPTAGAGAAVAWDERRRGIVRFGGRALDSTVRHAETWFFDGTQWTELALPTSPPPRDAAAMGFDRVDGCLVLRGGRDAQLLTDLWRLDDTGWNLIDAGRAFSNVINIGDPPPTPANSVSWSSGVAVTDPISGRVQFVGGTFGLQTFSGALVTFDGTRLVSGPGLVGAVSPGAAWDLARQQLVVLGGSGFNLGNTLQRLFVIFADGTARRPPEGRAPPEAAEGAAVVYDRSANRTILFGGSIAFGASTALLSSTRSWDGRTSTTIDDGGSVDLPFGGLFFDGVGVGGISTGRLFALDDDGWVDDGVVPATTPTSGVAFTWHAGDDVAFGFGGATGSAAQTDITMTVRDGVITLLSPTTRPPARRRAQVVYDARADRVVLYGGTSPAQLRDTWVYEDDSWRALDTSTADVGDARLVYDETRGVVVRLARGSGTSAILVDELRDDRWQRRDVFVPGAARADFNASWDVARRQTFVQGGSAAGNTSDEVFTWDGDANTTPAVLMAVDLRARDAGAGVVRSIDIIGDAGATGADLDGSSVDGVDVLVWGDAWRALGGNDAGHNDAAAIGLTVDDDAMLQEIAKGRLVVAVAASAASGGGPAAALHVEALEVTVRYRED